MGELKGEGRGKRVVPGLASPLVAWLQRHEAHNQRKGRCLSGLAYPSILPSLDFPPPTHTVKAE